METKQVIIVISSEPVRKVIHLSLGAEPADEMMLEDKNYLGGSVKKEFQKYRNSCEDAAILVQRYSYLVLPGILPLRSCEMYESVCVFTKCIINSLLEELQYEFCRKFILNFSQVLFAPPLAPEWE